MNVDLPAPFGPRIAACWRNGIVIVSASSTRAPPSTTVASTSSRKGVIEGMLDCPLMPAAVSVLVAEAQRMTAVGGSINLPGRVLRFVASNLAAALEGIRTSKAGLLAVDAQFATMPEGQAFVDRVQKLAIPGLEIRLVVRTGGVWSTTPLEDATPAVPAARAGAPAAAAAVTSAGTRPGA